MAETYRVRLADGQVFDMHRTPAAIRKQYPDAHIEGRIVLDDLGQGRVVPYHGEQPAEPDPAEPYEAMTVPQLRDEIERRALDKPAADARKPELVAVLVRQDADTRATETAEGSG